MRAYEFFKQQSPTASFPEFVAGKCISRAVVRGHTAVLEYCVDAPPDAPSLLDSQTQHANVSVTFHAIRARSGQGPLETNGVIELEPVAFEECPYFVYRWAVSPNLSHTLMTFIDALGLLRWLKAAHGRSGHIEVMPGTKLNGFQEEVRQIFGASFGTTPPPGACFVTRTQTSLNVVSSPTLEHANFVRTTVRAACKAPSGAGKLVLVHRSGRGDGQRNFKNVAEVLSAVLAVAGAVEIRKSIKGGLCEQCLLYADASLVVSPHGQQLSSMWCMQPGSVLIEVFPWLFFHPLYQFYATSMGLHAFGSFGMPLLVPPSGEAAKSNFDVTRCMQEQRCRAVMRSQMITVNMTHFTHVLSSAVRLVPAL